MKEGEGQPISKTGKSENDKEVLFAKNAGPVGVWKKKLNKEGGKTQKEKVLQRTCGYWGGLKKREGG